MTINLAKLLIAGAIALACIAALALHADTNAVWAVPVLGIVVGYIAGNAQVTSQSGTTAPIISTRVK
jgi:hypothetical protein